MKTLSFLILLGSPALAQSTPIVPAPFGDNASGSAAEGRATFSTVRHGNDRRVGTRIEEPSVDARAPAALVHGIDHSVMHYRTQDGSLWARGANYKVSFDAAGATYIPSFGQRAAHNVPHMLSPDLVTLGGEPLAFQPAASAVRDQDHVDLDRGAFVESYDLTPGALEQSFVFTALPRGGDLRLHIPVASELETAETSAGLEFRGELGRVAYGRASAIDARGRRQSVVTTFANGAIELELDASFVDTAALPLVIDPVVSTFVINGSSSNDYYSDAAYDPHYDQWIVVYEEKNSGADSDVFVVSLDSSGVVFGGFYLDLSTDSWESVHCADNAEAHQWLIVATVVHGSSQTIQGFEFDAGIVGGHQFLIANSFLAPFFPVVGGDPSIGSGPTRCCVAFARAISASDWDIRAVLVDTSGNVTSEIPVSPSGGTVDTSPAISKSNDHNEWMIAWQRNSPTVGNLAGIFGARIRWDGVFTAGPFQISSTLTGAQSPAVSSPLHGQLRFAVAWQQRVGNPPYDYDIIVSLLQGGTVLNTVDLYALDPNGLDQFHPNVDSDGQHFLVSHSDGFGVNYDLYATDLFVLGDTLGIAQTAMPLDESSSTTDDSSRVVSMASAGSTNAALKHRFLVTWNSGPVGGSADILGAFVDSNEGGGKTPFCLGDSTGFCPCTNGTTGHGCSNSANSQGALLSASGYASPTNDTLVLQSTGTPPNALCIFLQGTQNIGPSNFGDGDRCLGGTLIRLKSLTASAGAASLPVPGGPSISVLGNVPATGGTRYYQVWYRDPAANFCTSETYNISNGMIVVWAH